MKLFYLITAGCMFFCSCSENTKNSHPSTAESPVKIHVEVKIKLDDLKYLLDKMDSATVLQRKLKQLAFHETLSDVYNSDEMLTSEKPKHWMNFARMGRYSSVNFKTADEQMWKDIITELKANVKPKKFTDGTSDLAERYNLKGYMVETYEPINGVNLSLNNLYEVIIMKPQKKG